MKKESDLVFSGEGCFDDQSILSGKAVGFIIDLCEKYGKPYVVICGRKENIPQTFTGNEFVFDLQSRFGEEESLQNTVQCFKTLVHEQSKKFPLFSSL
jgi:glycerate kinase